MMMGRSGSASAPTGRSQIRGAITCLLVVICLTGCGSTTRSLDDAAARDPAAAARAYQRGVAVMESEPVNAMVHFRAAVAADSDHGAAYNNLGVLAMEDGRLDLAVRSLERARLLLPGDPDPRINLAIALHRGGNTAGALESAMNAVASAPEHMGAVQTAAWIAVRENRAPDDLGSWLHTIAQRGTTAQWRRWALDQRTRLDQPQAQPALIDH